MTTELEPVPRVSTLKGLQAAGARSGIAIGLEMVAVAVWPLVLTVVPGKAHPIFAGTVYDPPPTYGGALGGSATRYIDQYRVVSEVPGFVGPPAYRGEQLLTWWPKRQTLSLQGLIGLYHASFNQVSWSFPQLNANGADKIRTRRVAQVLLMGLDDRYFAQAVRALAPFDPVVVRRRTFREPAYIATAWLVDLRQYLKRPRA